MGDIRVHIDTLEYTRDGLKTKKPLNLQVGTHNRVVLVRPNRVRPENVAQGGFMVNSSFPTPPVLLLGLTVALDEAFERLRKATPAGLFQVYGHADATGEPDLNKKLSERRAEVVCALLRADVEALERVSEEEGWSTLEHQIALRVLRCDPGPIDGELGALTNAAILLFQREYNAGLFFRHKDAPDSPLLAEDGDMGPKTRKAILESVIATCSPELPEARLHPTHPTVGCSEFNRRTLVRDSPNRRVSLLVHPSLPAHHDQAPCKAGDTQVCPLDGQDERTQCLWYREHVVELPPQTPRVDVHFDLRWLPLPNGRILLSALTSSPENTEVTFRVWRSGPAHSIDDLNPDNLESPLSDELKGILVGGVAQVVWDPPDDFHPHKLEPHVSRKGFTVPVFELRTPGQQTLSPPPGEDLSRLSAHAEFESPPNAFIVSRDAFGNLHVSDTREGRTETSAHPLSSNETFVTTVDGAARRRHST